jgi:hypothetical protein
MTVSVANAPGSQREKTAEFSIHFPSLFREGQALAFPCDAQGRVSMDNLSERARENYLFARAMIGRDFGWPRVQLALRR